jgi:hypothetical protein
MRPGQQNKRGRGRNNNNNNNGGRKGGNPLSRTYDSSGPDVKIWGTAQHIAEKYATLARDAQGSGDNVMAENYLQHAEHYNRIIAAAQLQMQERYQRDEREGSSDHGDEGNYERGASDRQENYRGNGQARANGRDHTEAHGERGETDRAATDHAASPSQPQHVNGSGPQPVIEGTPAEVAMEEEESSATSKRGGPRRAAAGRPRRQPRKSAQGSDGGAADQSAGDGNAPESGGESSPNGSSIAVTASD